MNQVSVFQVPHSFQLQKRFMGFYLFGCDVVLRIQKGFVNLFFTPQALHQPKKWWRFINLCRVERGKTSCIAGFRIMNLCHVEQRETSCIALNSRDISLRSIRQVIANLCCTLNLTPHPSRQRFMNLCHVEQRETSLIRFKSRDISLHSIRQVIMNLRHFFEWAQDLRCKTRLMNLYPLEWGAVLRAQFGFIKPRRTNFGAQKRYMNLKRVNCGIHLKAIERRIYSPSCHNRA